MKMLKLCTPFIIGTTFFVVKVIRQNRQWIRGAFLPELRNTGFNTPDRLDASPPRRVFTEGIGISGQERGG